MPMPIVAATCPVPECNLVPRDVESLVVELEAYAGQFLSAFARADQAVWGHRYLQGLVSDHPRKSIGFDHNAWILTPPAGVPALPPDRVAALLFHRGVHVACADETASTHPNHH